MILTRALAALLLTLSMQTTPEPGFTSLFNGKDFTDWKVGGPAETFTVQDGAIVARGTPSMIYYDGPFRNHAFRNFQLKVDVMSKPGSNGGIWIMTDYQDRVWPAKGFEIQVNNSHRDPIRTGSLYHVQDVMNDSPAKDDVWCTLDILAQTDTIVVRVDDKEVVRWTGTGRGTSASGALARAPSGSRATTPTASSTTRTSESSRWTEGTAWRTC